jgi:hypothetical protein
MVLLGSMETPRRNSPARYGVSPGARLPGLTPDPTVGQPQAARLTLPNADCPARRLTKRLDSQNVPALSPNGDVWTDPKSGPCCRVHVSHSRVRPPGTACPAPTPLPKPCRTCSGRRRRVSMRPQSAVVCPLTGTGARPRARRPRRCQLPLKAPRRGNPQPNGRSKLARRSVEGLGFLSGCVISATAFDGSSYVPWGRATIRSSPSSSSSRCRSNDV